MVLLFFILESIADITNLNEKETSRQLYGIESIFYFTFKNILQTLLLANQQEKLLETE